MLADPVFKAKEIIPNRFTLCVVSFERARQLIKGARARTEKRFNSHVTTALQEVAEGKLVSQDPKHFTLG